MIRKIGADQRHFSDFGWLQTYWLFSFSDYYDPDNIQFGALRVFNDDVVAPGKGFPMHSHREMEIVTIVLEGRLTHEDSLGHKGEIGPGEVQRMSAGTGITHSEFNRSTDPCHLYQIWIYPDEQGRKPGYEQRKFSDANGGRANGWLLPLASGRGLKDVVTMGADATIALGTLGVGDRGAIRADGSRRLFVYVTSGEVQIEGLKFGPRDQARIDPEGPVEIVGLSEAGIVLIDVPSCRGWGYDKETLGGRKEDRP